MKDPNDDRPGSAGEDDLDGAAVAWLVLLRSGRAQDCDREGFALWRRQSLAHERAARGAERLWQDVGLTAAAQRARPRSGGMLVRRFGYAAAGLVAALCAAAGADRYWPAGGIAAITADVRTGVGERRDMRLADGSTLHLNAGTAIDIDLRAESRRILLHVGEIAIDVAADSARPFVVLSGGGAAVALGTVYDVRHDGAVTTVTVAESRVRVAFPAGLDKADREARVVESGERLRYGRTLGLGLPERVDAESATAWRRGKLIFDGARLDDVVAEVNRQRPGRIVLADGRLRDLKVTGVFDLDAPDAVLDTIARTLPVRITRLPYVTLLR